ncbi:putative methyltransferase-domain-containing protein [Gymnopilus junonius]|uniref:Methyltransferase-domain-containing protein n=1 Tax=Gymnopilus junonius TaxID=109634 RepID=A0A9P5NPE6_GYMJU|nr:putative methyltransferase-domain-containing protein [Gymnopilus junonius]
MSAQPAHFTKHISLLSYPFLSSTFTLTQVNDGISNGTALWLGGQCLAMYLAQEQHKLRPQGSSRPPRAIELGSGIGLTALALSSLGWDLLATDLRHVISSVLEKNVKNNLSALPSGSGKIQIRELDWLVPPDKWFWDQSLPHLAEAQGLIRPPFDLIVSADTIYSTELLEPMLRTLHALSALSKSSTSRFPPILLCIERRDPELIDQLLENAKEKWQFSVERIPHKKVAKIVEKSAQWDKSEWDDVELWKLRLRTQ